MISLEITTRFVVMPWGDKFRLYDVQKECFDARIYVTRGLAIRIARRRNEAYRWSP